jgi:hypothetical protein
MAKEVKCLRGSRRLRGLLIRSIGARRLRALLALAALGTLTPAILTEATAAGTCVSMNQCQFAGGIPHSIGGIGPCTNVCTGGGFDGLTICNGNFCGTPVGGGGSGSSPSGKATTVSEGLANILAQENRRALRQLEENERDFNWVLDVPGLNWFAAASAATAETSPTPSNTIPAPSSHLGMYVTSGTPDRSGFGPDPGGYGAMGGGAVTKGSGYGLTDTAGLLAPGTTAPSFRDTTGDGGFKGSYDASRLLPTNQKLLFSGYFDYARDNASLGSFAGLGSAGSFSADTYTFGGSVLYQNASTYLRGAADYSFGRGNESQTVDDSTGSFNFSGYSVDARLGNVFVLFNTGAPSAATMPTKAPPKPAGGSALALDLSGHLGYSDMKSGTFTDSSGFTFGAADAKAGDVGARARLLALMPAHDWLWMPYVSATVDQEFGVSNTFNIPSQATLPGGDVISILTAKTFLGGDLGVDVRGPGGVIVGVKGFYEASADTNITGGNLTVKVPLNYTPKAAWTTKY